MFVGLGDLFNVVVAHGAFAGRVLLAQPPLQHLRRGLQINHQVGRGQVLAKIIVEAVVNRELCIAKVEAGEELVFFKNVIGNNGLARVRARLQFAELLIALDQECKLRLEGGAAFAFIKCRKKSILLRLAHPLRVHALGNDFCQSALSNSYGTFNGDVAGQFEEIGHDREFCRSITQTFSPD